MPASASVYLIAPNVALPGSLRVTVLVSGSVPPSPSRVNVIVLFSGHSAPSIAFVASRTASPEASYVLVNVASPGLYVTLVASVPSPLSVTSTVAVMDAGVPVHPSPVDRKWLVFVLRYTDIQLLPLSHE